MKVFTGRSAAEYLVVPAGATHLNSVDTAEAPIDKKTGKPALIWDSVAIEEVLVIDIHDAVDDNFTLGDAMRTLQAYRAQRQEENNVDAAEEAGKYIDWISYGITPIEIHTKHEGFADHVKEYN